MLSSRLFAPGNENEQAKNEMGIVNVDFPGGHILPYDKYNLISIWVSTLFYGMNVVFFGISMYALHLKSAEGRKQYVLLFSSVLIFLLASVHIALSFVQLTQSFTNTNLQSVTDGIQFYWMEVNYPIAKAKDFTSVFADALQNCILIWRYYVVWGRDWKTLVLPSGLEVIHLVLGIYDNVEIPINHDNVHRSDAQFVSCFAVNIICTLGIVYRLCKAAWSNRRSGQSTNNDFYLHTAVIVLESGALFSSFSLIVMVTYAMQTLPSLAVMQSFVGIGVQVAVTAPLLILIRAHFGIGHGLGPLWKEQEKGDVRTMTTLQIGVPTTGGSHLESFGTNPIRSIATCGMNETSTALSDVNEMKVELFGQSSEGGSTDEKLECHFDAENGHGV